MNILERLYFHWPGGMFRDYEGIQAYFEPKDLSLYQKLLPKPFSVPRQPIVSVFVADYHWVLFFGPIYRYTYQEWAVSLKSEFKGDEAWYVVTMPVTRWFAMAGGRYLGFPKYVADEIKLTKTGETRLGEAKHKGIEQLTLEYCPGVTRPLAPWEKELLEKDAFLGDGHLLVPPGKGPRAHKATMIHAVPPKWSPQQGMIRVRVHPSESWAGLVPDIGEFPGVYNHFIGGGNVDIERLV